MNNINYSDYPMDKNQYSYNECRSRDPVPAKYRKTIDPADQENIFISALPFARTSNQVNKDYSHGVDGYNQEEILSLSDFEKINLLSKIRLIRIPLNYQCKVEILFNNILTSSYQKRQLVLGPKSHTIICGSNNTPTTSAKLTADEADGTDSGIALLGFSGSGKSTTVGTLLTQYPQIISHTLPNGDIYTQLVYIVINCTENSDFKTLLMRMAGAMDEALGCGRFCQSEVMRYRNTGAMTDKISEFIQLFAVGAIVIDEIQEMDFANTKTATFNNIMTIANRTKVGLFVIGTELAFKKMFTNEWVMRRVGHMIHSNDYCKDPEFFTKVLKTYLEYQYINEPIQWSESIDKAFFDNSQGIISILRDLFIDVQKEYIMLGKDFRNGIDATFIDQVARENFPGYREYLKTQIDPFDCASGISNNNHVGKNANVVIDVNAALNKLQDESGPSKVFDMFIYVKKYIGSRTHDYNNDTIRNVYDRVIKSAKYSDLPYDDLAEVVYQKLKTNKKSDKRGKIKSPITDVDRKKHLIINATPITE